MELFAGWFMAEVIEKELGRDALIAALCDSRELLATYNKAAKASGTAHPLWPSELVNTFKNPGAESK